MSYERVWTKKKLILSGLEIAQMGSDRTKAVIEAWAAETGYMDKPGAYVHADVDLSADTLTYTIQQAHDEDTS